MKHTPATPLWRVTVLRNGLAPLTYGPEPKARAFQRAASQSYLHGDCGFVRNETTKLITVDTGDWYTTRRVA